MAVVERPRKEVKPIELTNSVLKERSGFLPRDNERRKKADIVLKAIKRSLNDFTLENLQSNVVDVARSEEKYEELEKSAIKMLRIHYLDLSRTDEQRRKYEALRLEGKKKWREYKKKSQ